MKYLKLVFPATDESAVRKGRTSVRAVIGEKGRTLLLFARNLGVYTLPGGGVEEGEELETALRREAMEECGATINRIIEKLFIIEEFRPLTDSKTGTYKITSHYFLCSADKKLGRQQLTKKEMWKGITPVWIRLTEALDINRKILQSAGNSEMPWLTRETFAFQELLAVL
ncbi:MAG: NUDIX domain-containing protein [Spirochaetales bacterium]|nr:NUDIX domain-containing protein [Spirochaetales bacterium]